MLKAILFDIDGTLVDSNDLHVLAWDKAFVEAGYRFDRQALHDQVGKGGDNYVPFFVPEASRQEQDRIRDAHSRIYKNEYLEQVKPFPGARDLMQRCVDAGYKVVLASSAKASELDHYLTLLDASDLVDAHTSGDDVDCSKPCPDVFETALQQVQVEPSHALVIGDTPYDIEAAAKAGVRTIAVRSGGFSDDRLTGAMAIFDSVGELLERFDASPLSRVEEAV
jgi:HAD superfamily hydrolase (TIGR01549 family)